MQSKPERSFPQPHTTGTFTPGDASTPAPSYHRRSHQQSKDVCVRVAATLANARRTGSSTRHKCSDLCDGDTLWEAGRY
eukprot:6645308-Prymnesium_polylepis.2